MAVESRSPRFLLILIDEHQGQVINKEAPTSCRFDSKVNIDIEMKTVSLSL